MTRKMLGIFAAEEIRHLYGGILFAQTKGNYPP